MYPNKKGKVQAIDKINKILRKISKEELVRCIERYSREVRCKEKQFILNGSTFFNGRYEDYLDSNFYDENEEIEIQFSEEPEEEEVIFE